VLGEVRIVLEAELPDDDQLVIAPGLLPPEVEAADGAAGSTRVAGAARAADGGISTCSGVRPSITSSPSPMRMGKAACSGWSSSRTKCPIPSSVLIDDSVFTRRAASA
jgi:hypothetical protein